MRGINLNKRRISWKIKLAVLIFLFTAFMVSINQLGKAIARWFDTYTIQWNQIVSVTIKPPFEIKKREVSAEKVIEVVEKIPQPQGLKTDIEKYIYEKWGIEHFRIAIAVAQAESGLNCNAINVNTNGSVDLSIFQINSLWLKKYSLADLADCRKNVEIAHEIWDLQDGVVGNNQGSWKPWVAARNGRFLDFLK